MIAKTVRLALLTAATAALLAAADASAQVPFQVTASVAANCVIDAADDIDITNGTPWDPTSASIPTNTGRITVRCTRGTQYTIDLNGGVYADELTHTDGTNTLPYKFYDSTCAADFTPITFTATSRAARQHVICAGIDPADPLVDPVAGDYDDTVLVDITF